MFTESVPNRRFELPPHFIIGSLVALVLVAVGQPIMTDDLWWHLALGDAYAQGGPWLAHDPLLFTSSGPPVAAAWLADLGLASIANLGGFTALRWTHVLLVTAILALAWSLLRRASHSRVAASLCTGAFIVLSAYRLIQLRPHLLTILFSLILYRLLLESKECPSRRRVVAAVALCALWANLHAGFLLGPVLLGVGIAGLVIYEIGSARSFAPVRTPRVVWLGIALVLGTLATGFNPAGIDPHMAYLVAGSETPSLTRVADEWVALAAFRFPQAGSQPTPMAWIIFWLLLSGSLLAGIGALKHLGSDEHGTPLNVNPVLLALSALGVVAPLVAVRFIWLGIFPLLLLSTSLGSWLSMPLGSWLNSHPVHQAQKTPEGKTRSLAALGCSTAAALVLLVGFIQFGDWPGVSRSIPPTLQQFAQPYFAAKYQAHAAWMLDDANLEGNLFNEYYMGGFLGYWLAPRLRTFVNGSLNVSRDAMDANLPIREHRGVLAGESFLELLDRQGIDVFLGMGLPRLKLGNRPWYHTTAHLENTPGWILVFRNITSSVYLRDNRRNAENLARVAVYYRDRGVAFDSARGFDTARVIRDARNWAITNGVIPTYYDQLVANSRDAKSQQGLRSLSLLASFYSALGLYDEAIEIDRGLLEQFPDVSIARRRLAWCSLRVGAFADAVKLAEFRPLRGQADPLLQAAGKIARIATEGTTEEGAEEKLAGKIARLPVFTFAEARNLRAGMATPELRKALSATANLSR
ncbi:MAG: tetratricopeptide repeat protein [Myxococcales bacterium]|nr:tetratricopeptide repeat protein [Myxococcales bacterium]